MPTWTVVIPAYNEEQRIGPTLAAIRDWADGTHRTCEVIVVDDGSTDATADVVRRGAWSPLEVRVLASPFNRGKGYVARIGLLAASGEWCLLCDADQSAPIAEAERLASWLEQGYDVAIGSRDLPDSRLDPPQPALRRRMAGVFRCIRRGLLVPEIRDTQCGFKLMRRAVARDVAARQSVDGWLFDCEFLGIASRLGYRIREVGITWRDDPAGKVRPFRVALTVLPLLVALRRRIRRIEPGSRADA